MHLLRDFLADSRKPPKRTSRREKTTIIIRASRSLTKTGLCWGWFCEPRRAQDASKTRQDALMTRQDAPKTRQDAPRRAQDAPRRLQDAPRRAQDAPKTPPRRPKTPQDASKTRLRSIFGQFLMDFLVDFPRLFN